MALKEAKFGHQPVLLAECLKLLRLDPGDCAVDATLGLGSHAKAILEKIGKKGILFGFEVDLRNLRQTQKNLEAFKRQIIYFHDNFVHLKKRLKNAGIRNVDAILFDLGLSSPQVEEGERGFSFQKEGPLDMRFDRRQHLTAAEIINCWSEEKLLKIFQEYGEERQARRIVKALIKARKEKPFKKTTELTQLILRVKKRDFKKRIHPAAQVFQALRIAVNNELALLQEAVPQAIEILRKGGRLVVISYHSLEDRISKNIFRNYSKCCICPPEVLRCQCRGRSIVKILTKKPIIPSPKEVSENPRSRSAKLRALEKL